MLGMYAGARVQTTSEARSGVAELPEATAENQKSGSLVLQGCRLSGWSYCSRLGTPPTDSTCPHTSREPPTSLTQTPLCPRSPTDPNSRRRICMFCMRPLQYSLCAHSCYQFRLHSSRAPGEESQRIRAQTSVRSFPFNLHLPSGLATHVAACQAS